MERSLVCWRRGDLPGHEVGGFARLPEGGWRLDGTVAMAWNGLPCALRYAVLVDDGWRTRHVAVAGTVGGREHDIVIRVDDGRWFMDDAECPRVAGCLDVDLAFTPSTNLLPVRRLALPVGGSAPVRAAWLRFPEMVLEPLDQRYERTAERGYRYESRGGAFRAELEVDGHGLVVRYGDIWTAEASL